jgi:hypothetical protein
MPAQVRIALAASFAAVVQLAAASVPTMNDCLEASDFVANAARSRDNGVDRESFVDRLHQDFVAIRAFPPSLRWFVKDDDDETFLAGAAADVYDHPQAPDQHRRRFLRACLERAMATEPHDAASRATEVPATI